MKKKLGFAEFFVLQYMYESGCDAMFHGIATSHSCESVKCFSFKMSDHADANIELMNLMFFTQGKRLRWLLCVNMHFACDKPSPPLFLRK